MQDEKTLSIGNPAQDALSLIQDPFLLKNVQSINIHGMPLSGRQHWNAEVSFRSGLTAGRQDTGSCKSFEEVIQKLRAILDEVQRK